MLTSAFISVLSAFLAVCATLLYQQWLNPNAATVIQQHVLPSAPVSTAEINLQQQQEQQEQQQDQEQEQQQDQKSSNTNSPSPPKIDLAQALGLGRVLSSRGEQEEAALVYRVAVSAAVAAHDGDVGTNRDGGEAQHGLGLALLAAGRSEEALEACQEAERLDSSSAAASSCVGVLMTGAGDTAGAVEALRRAVEKAVAAREGDGTIDAMRGRLGGALLDAGDVDEAISVMSGGSSVDPHMAYNLGVAWQTKGETDKAIIAYTRAVELAPALAAPRVNLGAQLLQSGRLPKAEMVLLSAVELAQDDPLSLAAARANLGAVLQRTGRPQEALASYSQAVQLGAGRSSLMHIAKIHQDLGKLDQALEAYRRAMLEDGDPLDTSPRLQTGLILETLGDIEEAAEHFAKVIELDDENVEAATHLGSCQQRLGRHHEALASYLAASRLEPDNPVIYEMLLSAVSEAKKATGGITDDAEADTFGVIEPEGRAAGAVDAADYEGEPSERVGNQMEEAGSGQALTLDASDEGAPSHRVGEGMEEIEPGQAAVDAIHEGVPSDRMLKMEETESASLDRDDRPMAISADGERISEAPSGEKVEERVAGGGMEPDIPHAVEGGNRSRGQDSEAGAAAAALEAAAAAAAAAEQGEEKEVVGERTGTRQSETEISGVGGDSSSGRDTVDAPGGSTTKAIPRRGVGSSVRQDSADIRRQSELLSKDNDAGATTTRAFFGKSVSEGSKDPAAAGPPAAVAAGVSATPAGLDEVGGGEGAGADGGGTANVVGEVTSSPVNGFTAHGGSDGRAAGNVASERARQGEAGATDGGKTAREEEIYAISDGEGIPTTAIPGAAQGASLQSDLQEKALAAEVFSDDEGSGVAGSNADESTAGAGLEREDQERLVLPPVAVAPDTGGDGVEDNAKVVGLPAAAARDASVKIEIETGSARTEVGEASGAIAGPKNNTDDELQAARNEERPLNATPVLKTDAAGETASPSSEDPQSRQPADDPDSEAQGDASSTNSGGSNSSTAKDSERDGIGDIGLLGGERVGIADPVVDADRRAAPSPVSGDQGKSDGVAPGLDEVSTIASADDVAALAGDGVDVASGAAVDDALLRAREGGETETGERIKERLEGVARDPSVPGVEGNSDTPATGAEVASVESTPGKNSDQSSTTVAAGLAAESDSSPEDNMSSPTTTKEGTANKAVEREGVTGGDAAGSESATTTTGSTENGSGSSAEVAVGGDKEAGGDGDAAERVAAAGAQETAASGAEEAASSSSSGEGADASAAGPGTRPGSFEAEAVTADADAAAAAATAAATATPADVTAAPVVVSEEEGRRARAKAKLGMAKLQQGQAKKAASLFEKAASIDPGWWGGFYYAAQAHDVLGNPEAAAGYLASALSVPAAPTEEGELAELTALSSKVLSALGGEEKGPIAEMLKTAMDASGLEFAAAPPARESSYPSSPDRGKNDTAAPRGGSGGAGIGVGGRSASMGGGAGAAGGAGGGSGGPTGRTGIEADLASQFGGGGTAAAAPSNAQEAGGGAKSAKSNRKRWPFSGEAGPGGGRGRPAGGGGGGATSPSLGGGAGTVPGTNREAVPRTAQRGEAVANGRRQPQHDSGRTGGAGGGGAGRRGEGGGGRGGDGGGLRENSGSASGGGDGEAPSKPDVGRRRTWGRPGKGGDERAPRGAGGSPGDGASAAGRGSGGGGRPSYKIDSTASSEDILASMGLKGGVPDLRAVGGQGARTPEDMMAAGSSGGGNKGEGGKKNGLFGGLFRRKGKGK